jgi:hypothetical protein
MQLSRLPSLEILTFEAVKYAASSMASLSCLCSLTYLTMNQGRHLPSGLAAMTWLKRLQLGSWGSPLPPAELATSLRQLRQMTCLLLHGDGISQLPTAALAGLSRLQLCMIKAPLVVDEHAAALQQVRHGQQEQAPPRPLQQLPAGPWLSSLCHLCTHWELLAQGTAVLAQAQQLEHLAIVGIPSSSHRATAQQWEAFWEWAATHPPLQRLSIDVNEEPDPSAFDGPAFDEVLKLLRRRPGLSVYRAGRGTEQAGFIAEYKF